MSYQARRNARVAENLAELNRLNVNEFRPPPNKRAPNTKCEHDDDEEYVEPDSDDDESDSEEYVESDSETPRERPRERRKSARTGVAVQYAEHADGQEDEANEITRVVVILLGRNRDTDAAEVWVGMQHNNKVQYLYEKEKGVWVTDDQGYVDLDKAMIERTLGRRRFTESKPNGYLLEEAPDSALLAELLLQARERKEPVSESDSGSGSAEKDPDNKAAQKIKKIMANALDDNGDEIFLVWWRVQGEAPSPEVTSNWEPLSTVKGQIALKRFRRSKRRCQSMTVLQGKLKRAQNPKGKQPSKTKHRKKRKRVAA
jgi:hypothetical protein